MVDPGDLPREERYVKALRFAEEYRRRQAGGTAEPLEQFLMAHADVRRQLAALLANATVLPSAPAPKPQAKVHETVGPYRILSFLGAGAMGSVHLAERQDPEQRVALKVMRPGHDSEALLAHFQQERKALARMNHDAIAKVFDFGTMNGGEPYFVMELVEHGMPLTSYCDARELSIRERIVLFQRVCEGVQHAHLKGVVHRDLKPGNVLVAPQDERHVVKIIDFGIAGSTEPSDAAAGNKQRPVGTPEYMSPEQAAGDPQYIDSRTDVYSLGVMLYEILTGELPFASAELRELPTVALRERLRDSEPQRPSTRITTSGEKSTTSAASRRMSVKTLARTLRDDLDWIVLKAMAKDPEQRYPTPGDLALDLQRYLSHKPVLPQGGLIYRLRKAAVRHGRGVSVGTALGALLVAGATTFLFRNEAVAAHSQLRRSQLVSAWKKLRQPDLLEPAMGGGDAAPQASLAREIGAYEAVLEQHGINDVDADLRALYREASEDRVALLDELYWLETRLARCSLSRDAGPRCLTLAGVNRLLLDWEHRPWRLEGLRARHKHRAGEPSDLLEFIKADLSAVSVDDLEWLTIIATPTIDGTLLLELLNRINTMDNGRWWVRFRLATLTGGRERLMHSAAAVALANESTATWYNHAWNFQFIKEPPFNDAQEAVRGYRKAIELDRTNWRAYLNLSYLVSDEEGVALMRNAVEEIQHADLYHRLAERLRTVHRCDEAVEVSRRALERFPDHPGLHAILGECLGWLARYEEAVAPLERVLAIDETADDVRTILLFVLGKVAETETDPKRRARLRDRRGELILQTVKRSAKVPATDK